VGRTKKYASSDVRRGFFRGREADGEREEREGGGNKGEEGRGIDVGRGGGDLKGGGGERAPRVRGGGEVGEKRVQGGVRRKRCGECRV